MTRRVPQAEVTRVFVPERADGRPERDVLGAGLVRSRMSPALVVICDPEIGEPQPTSSFTVSLHQPTSPAARWHRWRSGLRTTHQANRKRSTAPPRYPTEKILPFPRCQPFLQWAPHYEQCPIDGNDRTSVA